MDVALSGRRRWSLSRRLAPHTYLLAVVHAACANDTAALEAYVLDALSQEIEQRAGRGLRRARAISGTLNAAVCAVNERVRASYGSDQDRVAAAASLTAVLVVRTTGAVAHVGTTGAYLHRDAELRPLAEDEPFEEAGGLPVLSSAIGLHQRLDARTRVVELRAGDILVLSNHRLRRDGDRARVAARLATSPGEPRIERDVVFVPLDALIAEESYAGNGAHPARRTIAAILATLLIYAALCIH